MPSNYVQNVAIIGAGGNVGSYMTKSLLESGRFTITALSRESSKSPIPEGVKVVRLAYDDDVALVAALKDQEALVITLAGFTPPDLQPRIIRAAAEAGVSYVFPNEWSPDSQSPELAHDLNKIWASKETARNEVERHEKLAWISVTTGFWYEWSLAIPFAYGFDFANKQVTLFDDGKTRICTSTWPQVGRAVTGLLSLPIKRESSAGGDATAALEDYRNRYVYVNSFTISQREMLASVLRVTGDTEADWTIKQETSLERFEAGKGAFEKGDMSGMGKWLYSRVFFLDGVGNFEQTRGLANDKIGLPKEDLDEATKRAIQRASKEAGRWSH